MIKSVSENVFQYCAACSTELHGLCRTNTEGGGINSTCGMHEMCPVGGGIPENNHTVLQLEKIIIYAHLPNSPTLYCVKY